MGSLAIIWKANRNCTRGTPVRWPPGLRLRDSWWGREETQTLCGRALAAAQPISYMYARSIPLPFFPLLLLLLLLAPPLRTAQRRHSAQGSRRGWGGGEKSVVAMETTGREEVGLCAGWGWGVEGRSVSAWKQSLRPLHLHGAVHGELQEVWSMHHLK